MCGLAPLASVQQMSVAVETATPAGTAEPRVAYLDNARFWAIVLVVVGHALFYLTSQQPGRAIYYWIYLFHMPLFVLLSGYISRDFHATPAQIQRTVSTLVIPYLLIEPAYQLVLRNHTGSPDPAMLLSPKWMAWYLAALFIWRLSTPIWRTLRHPIAVSVAISLLVPLTEVPNVLALPKVLGLLPFYVIGMHMTLERFERLRRTRTRIVSTVVLAVVGVVCWMFSERWSLTWTKWRDRYDESPLFAGPFEGIATRSALLVVALIMCIAVMSVIPWRRSWTSAMGARTLYCYLLHGFVIFYLGHLTSVFTGLREMGTVGLAGTIAGAGLLAIVLLTPPVERIFRPLFEPNLNWAFKPASPNRAR